MVAWIIKNILKKADVTIRLNGDDLTVTVKLGNSVLLHKTFDILKDGIKNEV